MSMTTTPLMQVLQQVLNVTARRQSLVTANMANIDTPGYKTRDIDFRAELNRALDGNESAPMVQNVSGLLTRPDGNNVNLERESLLLAEGQVQFRLGVQLIRNEFHRVMTAINEGK